MPEGPEVKKVTRRLDNLIRSLTITSVKINSGRYTKKLPKNYDEFLSNLPLTVKSVNCYGKFIWWEFTNDDIDSDLTLWNTLGMTGFWTNEKDIKHNNVTFKFSNGLEASFNDYRNFGNIIFCSKENLQKKLNSFGPDILYIPASSEKDKQTIGLDKFKIKLMKKRSDTFIASALLDQKVAAGCGNYIRAEALYLSKINPFTEIKDLTDNNIKNLWIVLRQLAFNYFNRKLGEKMNIIDGKFKFAQDYGRVFLVYQQNKDVNGKNILKQKINGRTIHYVET